MKCKEWRISISFYGEEFDPTKIKFKFHEIYQKGKIYKGFKDKKFKCNYGKATYFISKKLKIRSEIFSRLYELFFPLIPSIKKAKCTRSTIYIERLYYAQCNESFSIEEIKIINKLGCELAYSAYSVKTEEEEKTGFIYF